MDKTDRRILSTLHHNARLTNPALAEKVGLSTSPCWSRVRRMEKEGIIDRYVTVVNQEKIGLPDTAIIEIMFSKHSAEVFSEFEQVIAEMPQVIEAYLLTGEFDCFMKVAVSGTKGYEEFLINKLHKIKGIKHTRSSLTIRCFKQIYSATP